MRILNPNARRSAYDASLKAILNLQAGHEARTRLSSWNRLAPEPTPAWLLCGTATALGIGAITLKDESKRSALSSFKTLGAPNALIQESVRAFYNGWYKELVTELPIVENGMIRLNDKPGLGLELLPDLHKRADAVVRLSKRI